MILQVARTVFWNGPMGVFEVEEQFSGGTLEISGCHRSGRRDSGRGKDSLASMVEWRDVQIR